MPILTDRLGFTGNDFAIRVRHCRQYSAHQVRHAYAMLFGQLRNIVCQALEEAAANANWFQRIELASRRNSQYGHALYGWLSLPSLTVHDSTPESMLHSSATLIGDYVCRSLYLRFNPPPDCVPPLLGGAPVSKNHTSRRSILSTIPKFPTAITTCRWKSASIGNIRFHRTSEPSFLASLSFLFVYTLCPPHRSDHA